MLSDFSVSGRTVSRLPFNLDALSLSLSSQPVMEADMEVSLSLLGGSSFGGSVASGSAAEVGLVRGGSLAMVVAGGRWSESLFGGK